MTARTLPPSKLLLPNLPSPCISICQIDPNSKHCSGCYRTRQEIAVWSRLDIAAQQNLISALQQRRADATGRPRRVSRRSASKSGLGE